MECFHIHLIPTTVVIKYFKIYTFLVEKGALESKNVQGA